MSMYKTVVLAIACSPLLCACISTTTGRAAPEADSGDAASLNYQLGARYYQAGNYELARDRLLLSIKLDPRDPITHSTLALTYEALDNLRLARASYEEALRVGPRNFDVQNTYAVFLCRQRDFAAAEAEFNKAANHPENDNAEVTLTNAGVCMVQKPDNDAAERFFRQALERRANYPEALLQLCLLKFGQQDYLASRAFLQRFIGTGNRSASVLYLGAQIEQQLGDERAKKDYEDQLLRNFPTSPEARKVLEAG
ncbi:MAG: type IV pilus biogenesis/stability protein PilW [Woeseiaceae bacterium]|nr:type IV pilus biogenesis/stability protein PilW [Woeseiaceae bacterium]